MFTVIYCGLCATYYVYLLRLPTLFLSATEYHSDADYISRRVGVVVVVVVVVVHKLLNALTDLLHIWREVVLG